MKKEILPFLRSFLFFAIALGISCSSFDPTTGLGKDVVKSVDPGLTDLAGGYKSVFMDMDGSGARSRVTPGADTTTDKLYSGVHADNFAVGEFHGEKATAYADFYISSSNLESIYTACSTGNVDSVQMILNYDTTYNDLTIGNNTTKIYFYSSKRKYYPGDRNAKMPDYNPAPINGYNGTEFNRKKSDSLKIKLGNDIVSSLKKAAADTTTRIRYPSAIDTVYGSKAVGRDTLFPDTVRWSRVLEVIDTIVIPNKKFKAIDSLQVIRHNPDTTVIAYKLIDTIVVKTASDAAKDSTIVNSVPHVDTIYSHDTAYSLNVVKPSITWKGDSVFRSYTQILDTLLSANFKVRGYTSDSTKKYIGSIAADADNGALVRFTSIPTFRVFYRTSCTDTVKKSLDENSIYYDITLTEINPNPALLDSSLITSWEADRFVEIPLSIQPLWDTLESVNNGKLFGVVQDASCSLSIDTASVVYENGLDSTRLIYGLWDGESPLVERLQSYTAKDSFQTLENNGLLKTTWISRSKKAVSLPVASFLQSYIDKGQKPSKLYLYLFTESSYRFARVKFTKPSIVTFSALFSNPKK